MRAKKRERGLNKNELNELKREREREMSVTSCGKSVPEAGWSSQQDFTSPLPPPLLLLLLLLLTTIHAGSTR